MMEKFSDKLQNLLSHEWIPFDVRVDLPLLEKIPKNTPLLILYGPSPENSCIEYIFLEASGILRPHISVNYESTAPWVDNAVHAATPYDLLLSVAAICIPPRPTEALLTQAYRRPKDICVRHDGKILWEGAVDLNMYHALVSKRRPFRILYNNVIEFCDQITDDCFEVNGSGRQLPNLILLDAISAEDIAAQQAVQHEAAHKNDERRAQRKLQRSIGKMIRQYNISFDSAAASHLFEKYKKEIGADLREKMSDYIDGWLTEKRFPQRVVSLAAKDEMVANDILAAIRSAANIAQAENVQYIEKRILKEIHAKRLRNVRTSQMRN